MKEFAYFIASKRYDAQIEQQADGSWQVRRLLRAVR